MAKKQVMNAKIDPILLNGLQIKEKIEQFISIEADRYAPTKILLEHKDNVYVKLPFSDFKISIAQEIEEEKLLIEQIHNEEYKLIEENVAVVEEAPPAPPVEEPKEPSIEDTTEFSVIKEIYEYEDEGKKNKDRYRSKVKQVDTDAVIAKIKAEAREKNKGKKVISFRDINKELRPYMIKKMKGVNAVNKDTMSSIDIYLNAVDKIDVVNDSTTLGTIRLPKHESLEEAAKGDAGKPWEKLEYLDIRNSTIKKIQYGSGDISSEVCDMSRMKNLQTLYCSGASAMTHMENLNYTAVNGLDSLFANCFELRRISGIIKTSHYNANSIFYRCHLLSDINDLTFEFKTEDSKPCITTANSAFYRCARATSAMLKKFLDACDSSLTSINNFIYMWGVDVNTSRNEAVIGTAADRPNRDIPSDLFVNTPNITSMESAFTETHYTTIPGTLFDPLKGKLQSLSSTFCHMDKLVTVGKDLLKNMTALTNCYGTFAKCYALKNYINEDPEIFKGSTAIITTNQMFLGCNNLLVGSNGISKLFDPLTNATTFEYMFHGCPITTFNSNLSSL